MKDREKLFARVKKYCDTHAPSGFEEAAMKLMKEDVKGAQSVEIDKYGNVIATIHGKKEYPKVMICAHIDEPGLIIKAIEDSGYIRFDMLGGMIEQHLGSQRVIIHTENGESITGVIGILPAHLLIPRGPEERYKVPSVLGTVRFSRRLSELFFHLNFFRMRGVLYSLKQRPEPGITGLAR
jgi:putative aminopeptidase FrvX